MLEAANARPRFTISLKRSTQNLQLSTSRQPIIPSLLQIADLRQHSIEVRGVPIADLKRFLAETLHALHASTGSLHPWPPR
jgi:hypothetical protein